MDLFEAYNDTTSTIDYWYTLPNIATVTQPKLTTLATTAGSFLLTGQQINNDSSFLIGQQMNNATGSSSSSFLIGQQYNRSLLLPALTNRYRLTGAAAANRTCNFYNSTTTDLIGGVEKRLTLCYPLMLAICLCGNAANLLIYHHKFLRSSTTIRMLAAKGVANIISMVSLFPNFLKSIPQFERNRDINDVYWNCLPYMMFITNVFATFSIWLTMVMSLERYALVAYPISSKLWCTMRNTYVTIVATFFLAALLQSSSFVARRLYMVPCYNDTRMEMQHYYLYVVTRKYRILQNVYYYLYAITSIFVPMLVMVVTTLLLNYHLLWSSKSFAHSAVEQKRCVTRLSLATTVCHLIFETPHMAVFILAAVESSEMKFWQRWEGLTAVANFFSMINATLPFFVYLSCSKRYRQIARIVLCCSNAPLDTQTPVGPGTGRPSSYAFGSDSANQRTAGGRNRTASMIVMKSDPYSSPAYHRRSSIAANKNLSKQQRYSVGSTSLSTLGGFLGAGGLTASRETVNSRLVALSHTTVSDNYGIPAPAPASSRSNSTANFLRVPNSSTSIEEDEEGNEPRSNARAGNDTVDPVTTPEEDPKRSTARWFIPRYISSSSSSTKKKNITRKCNKTDNSTCESKNNLHIIKNSNKRLIAEPAGPPLLSGSTTLDQSETTESKTLVQSASMRSRSGSPAPRLDPTSGSGSGSGSNPVRSEWSSTEQLNNADDCSPALKGNRRSFNLYHCFINNLKQGHVTSRSTNGGVDTAGRDDVIESSSMTNDDVIAKNRSIIINTSAANSSKSIPDIVLNETTRLLTTCNSSNAAAADSFDILQDIVV